MNNKTAGIADSIVLSPGVSVYVLPGSRVIFTGRSEAVFGSGPVYVAIACELAAGGRSIRPVEADATTLASWAYVANQLRAQGVVNGMRVPGVSVRRTRGGDPRLFDRAPRVSVHYAGGGDPSLLEAALTAAGFDVAREASTCAGEQGPTLQVAVTGASADPALGGLAEAAPETGKPWLPLLVVGETVQVGPLIGEGKACWYCFRARLEQARALDTYAKSNALLASPPPGKNLDDVAASIAGRLLWRSTHTPAGVWQPDRLIHSVVTMGRTDLVLREHKLIMVAGCPLHPRTDPTPVEISLTNEPPSRFSARHQRERSVRQSLQAVVSPALGLVRSVSAMSLPGSGIILARAVHTLPVQGPDPSVFPYVEGWGAGTSQNSAEVAALAEALQEQASVFRGTEARIRSSLNDLDGGIHPNECQLFSERQFYLRPTVVPNRPLAELDPRPAWVLARFDADEAVHWSALWNVTDQRWQYLPSTLCWSYHPQTDREVTCLFESNGCAAGSSLAEATEAGLLELIERDAVALWWYNELVCPRIDRAEASESAEPWFDFQADRGREAWLLRITSDLLVPTYVACSVRTERRGGLCVASASRYEDAEAQVAALRELAHRVLRWDAAPASATSWLSTLSAELPYIAGGASAPAEACSAAKLGGVLARLGEHGLKVLVLNQSRAESPLRSVKVVVPGLRHYWPRFAPGRLFSSASIAERGGPARNETTLNPHAFVM